MTQARQVADRLTEAFVAGDADALRDHYSEDALVVAPEGSFKGRDEIAAFFASWFTAFSDLAVDVSTKLDDGTTACDTWSIRATNSGPLEMPGGETLPATGRRLTVRGADVCTVEEGRITEHRMYYDQVEILGQLGLLAG
ncbi:MAG: ester cyclase [Acidimicrobiales bacterium]